MDIEEQQTQDLKSEPVIQEELERATGRSRRPLGLRRRERLAILIYGALIASFVLLRYLLQLKLLELPNRYTNLLNRALPSAILVVLLLLVRQITQTVVQRRVRDAKTRYNLSRIVSLLAYLLCGVVIATTLFANWYATLVSFGVGSLVIGLALQNPLSSFFAWLYILIRRPYAVGDRIKIGNVTGDVISLNYLDTTLWEFNGDYLSSDHPSGRLIRFPNSKVFQEYVINCSWPLFPYLWREIHFFVAYESDLLFIKAKAEELASASIGEEMKKRVRLYRNILRETPVDELEVNDQPAVSFRAHDNSWLRVTVRYIVEPKEAGQVRSRLFVTLITELSKYPDKVLFPKGHVR